MSKIQPAVVGWGMGQAIIPDERKDLTDLDKLLAMHPEIMRADRSKEGDIGGKFHWWWIDAHHFTWTKFTTDYAQGVLSRAYGDDYQVQERRFENRHQVLVAAWRKGYLDATPAEQRGERYLPSTGQLIEWELDANGQPRTLKVDGVSVDPSLLSKAKQITEGTPVEIKLDGSIIQGSRPPDDGPRIFRMKEAIVYSEPKLAICFFYNFVASDGTAFHHGDELLRAVLKSSALPVQLFNQTRRTVCANAKQRLRAKFGEDAVIEGEIGSRGSCIMAYSEAMK